MKSFGRKLPNCTPNPEIDSTEENHEKHQSSQVVLRPRFEPSISHEGIFTSTLTLSAHRTLKDFRRKLKTGFLFLSYGSWIGYALNSRWTSFSDGGTVVYDNLPPPPLSLSLSYFKKPEPDSPPCTASLIRSTHRETWDPRASSRLPCANVKTSWEMQPTEINSHVSSRADLTMTALRKHRAPFQVSPFSRTSATKHCPSRTFTCDFQTHGPLEQFVLIW